MQRQVARRVFELDLDRKALDDLSKASKTVVKTGPSEPFVAGARALAQAERQYLGKSTTPATSSRKKPKGKE